MKLIQVRCQTISLNGARCGKLLLEVASTNTGPLHCKCGRCKQLSVQMSSEAGRSFAVAR